jgi:peptidoglycan/LPS O-acetylase OafA/YrhL
MSSYLSQKIRNLSFLLMILVAYIHGFNLNLYFKGEGRGEISFWLQFFENFVSDGFCRVAVPMFFAISGYLASLKIEKFDFGIQAQMLRKRLRSLVLPYLLVSLSGILLVVVLLSIPASKPYFNNFSLSQPISSWIKVWIISPVPFQLWFIRFLWIYFLLYPLLYHGVKFGKWIFILFLIWIWSDISWQNLLFMHKMEIEGMLFFCLGIYFAVHKIPLEFQIKPSYFYILLFLWLGWIAYRTNLLINPAKDHYAVHYNILAITFSGFFLFWFSYDFLPESIRKSKWLRENAPYSIGVFLLHEPGLTILKKIMIKLIGMNDLSLFLSFIFSPAISFLAALYVAKKLNINFPKFYNLLTGNRAPKEQTL